MYTGGILPRLDTDVHSAVTAKTSTALWQRKQAQRCDSENKDSAVAAKTSLSQHCHLNCCHNAVHISVTAMATDSAATALSDATTLTLMCTSLIRTLLI